MRAEPLPPSFHFYLDLAVLKRMIFGLDLRSSCPQGGLKAIHMDPYMLGNFEEQLKFLWLRKSLYPTCFYAG